MSIEQPVRIVGVCVRLYCVLDLKNAIARFVRAWWLGLAWPCCLWDPEAADCFTGAMKEPVFCFGCQPSANGDPYQD